MKKIFPLLPLLALSIILGIHQGRVALWKSGSPEPAHIFPCHAAMLPREARAALEEGITITSIEQLEQLAENYLS